MKYIKYKIAVPVNRGTEKEPAWENIFYGKRFPYSESNYAIAEAEAYNGEVTVEEVPDENPTPTLDERVATLEESNAEMTEALDMILSGVTE